MNRKPIFDAARRLLRRAFTQREVEALDAAIDAALSPDPAPTAAHTIGPQGVALIQKWEGCAKRRADGRFEAYPDPGTGADPWTIGWGSTGPDIKPGLIWTQAQCDERFLKRPGPLRARRRTRHRRCADHAGAVLMPWSAFTTTPVRYPRPR